jgi:hypothetical protein
MRTQRRQSQSPNKNSKSLPALAKSKKAVNQSRSLRLLTMQWKKRKVL